MNSERQKEAFVTDWYIPPGKTFENPKTNLGVKPRDFAIGGKWHLTEEQRNDSSMYRANGQLLDEQVGKIIQVDGVNRFVADENGSVLRTWTHGIDQRLLKNGNSGVGVISHGETPGGVETYFDTQVITPLKKSGVIIDLNSERALRTRGYSYAAD